MAGIWSSSPLGPGSSPASCIPSPPCKVQNVMSTEQIRCVMFSVVLAMFWPVVSLQRLQALNVPNDTFRSMKQPYLPYSPVIRDVYVTLARCKSPQRIAGCGGCALGYWHPENAASPPGQATAQMPRNEWPTVLPSPPPLRTELRMDSQKYHIV